MRKSILSSLFLLISCLSLLSQDGVIRGFVFDKESGEPVIFTNVILEGSTQGATTDIDGFYAIPKVAYGSYTLVCSYVGYETSRIEITLGEKVLNQNINLSPSSTQLGTVTISAEKEEKTTEVKTGTISITPKQMEKLPSVGGEPDLAQYLQVLPGVTFTGDQGGQLYVRGGSPIQTNVLMDGLTVYNPFHSIGFFSVFDTDIIRNVDVLTGGFNASYGQRISAIVDIKTRDGNKKELGGKLNVNPFLSKIILEGPIKKFDDTGSSSSFILSAKSSYLDRSSKVLYNYIDTAGLPYSFNDFYGKYSVNSSNGSKFSLSGYRSDDTVTYPDAASFVWNAFGIGANFSIVPEQSKVIIGGALGYSKYNLDFDKANTNQDDASSIGGFNLALNFKYFLPKGGITYGLNIGGFRTELQYRSATNVLIDPTENTTNLSGFFDYRIELGKFIIEPSVRFNYYGALSSAVMEPRFGMKYNISDRIRFKASGGKYTQDILSSKNDQDVVNLFRGYLTTPDGKLRDIDGEVTANNLQIAWHAVGGLELDLTKNISLNLEGYYKDFTQIININRGKLLGSDPDFTIERGEAYGFDALLKYDQRRWFVWAVYTLGYVNRNDGNQIYPPHYDRRHNMNFLCSYSFGKDLDWSFNARWNYGSGFPFTKTQGFYEEIDFSDGIQTDYISQNGTLGVIYEDALNGGRLPDYHRLDISMKKSFQFTERIGAELTASVTNVYDRANIFYFDRLSYERVDQLPLLPSLGFSIDF